jgi:hypothetical protein
MDLANIDVFLSKLGDNAGVANGVVAQSQSLGQSLMQYIQGFGSADPYGSGSSTPDPSVFDDIVASLTKTWTGAAADAFKAQIQTVRTFGIGLAAAADKTWNTQASGVKMPPVEMQYELESMADYVGAAGTLNQVFSDIYKKYQQVGRDFDNWALNLAEVICNKSAEIQNDSWWNQHETLTVNVPTFAEFEDCASTTSGVLSITYSQSWALDPGNSVVSYSSPQFGTLYGPKTINWPAWSSDDSLNDQNKADITRAARDTEFLSYLPNLMNDLASQYTSVQPPPPQDNSVLPKTNGSGSGSPSSQNGYNGSYGNFPGYGSGSGNGGSYNPGGKNPGGYGGDAYVPGGYNPGGTPGGQGGDAYVPGGYNPGGTPGGHGGDGYLPGGYNPGSNAGGWNPSQLAGFNPNAGGGLGPGGGFGAGGGPLGGSGVPGAAGLGSGGGGLPAADGGLGTGAGVGGAAGAAGRGMPMAPMGGMGGGKEGKERQRAAWLTEDEDVWGAGDDGGDAVL